MKLRAFANRLAYARESTLPTAQTEEQNRASGALYEALLAAQTAGPHGSRAALRPVEEGLQRLKNAFPEGPPDPVQSYEGSLADLAQAFISAGGFSADPSD